MLGACAHDTNADDGAAIAGNASNGRDINLWPKIDTSSFLDPVVEARIDDLLTKMTLEQKVGQTMQADNAAITPAEVKEYRIGSILSGGNSAPGPLQWADVDQWLEAADAFYLASVDPEGVEVAIPTIWGIDAVHGHNNVIGGTVFPHNIGLGAMRNPELILKLAGVTARELRTTGHDWTFAPTVAVPQDDRWGRTYEGFSENPEVVASYAGEIVTGLQGDITTDAFLNEDHVISTAKHFLGDGGTDGGKDQGDALAEEAEFVRIHSAGYPPSIKAGSLSVMASFSSWQGEKVHGSKYLLTDVLKDRMGFQGFVVGDWNAHGQIDGCTNDNCAAALNAGLDMYMVPNDWKALYVNTLAQAQSGEIPMERLDDAVRRILRAKIKFGLFEMGKPSSRKYAGDYSILGAPEHRKLVRQAVRESLVLLKNNDGLLPLSAGANVLVAGDGADSISKQAGGWTLHWQGGGLSNDLFPNGDSIYAGIAQTVAAGGGSVQLSEDGNYTTKPDVAIVVFGEEPYAEFQGDREHVGFDVDSKGAVNLLAKLKRDGIPVVAVFLSGRPMWVNPELNQSDAFVAAFLPGTEGAGVADVLFQTQPEHDFKGTLSFSWPRTATQTVLNYGDANYDPLFAYGFGLNYKTAHANLASLPEDSGLSSAQKDQSISLYAGGQITAPWRVGINDEDVVSTREVDHLAQEDAIELTFSAPTSVSIVGDPIDISSKANTGYALMFDVKVDAAIPAGTTIGMSCANNGGDCQGDLAVSTSLNALKGQGWQSVELPLSCLRGVGAEMGAIDAPFVLTAGAEMKIAFSNVRIAEGTEYTGNCKF
ncbi:MAG: beta-glucosidase [Robiginitomaculum sp.]|nr:MAG: beta-glucosidase [Robiginitomaculum sp.]